MNYIYTVKPIKEATEIAIKHGHFEVEENGNITIYGIFKENWPAGVRVKSTKRITDGLIYNVGKINFSIPVIYFTETNEKEKENDTPDFIKNLYKAIRSDCAGVDCRKCPLSLTSPIDCDQLADWLEKRYPEL